MNRVFSLAAIALALVFAGAGVATAHCEIPCGIYGDMMRIALLQEDITTVEKSMKQVQELSKDPSANANQLVRWVNNKEEHCNKIQHTVTQYFMTQRVKPVASSDTNGHKAYLAKLASLHGMLIHAMKVKQTTDLSHVESLRGLVDEFSELYFSKEDLEHLREHHK
jgi:nickel superoxide dismutase